MRLSARQGAVESCTSLAVVAGEKAPGESRLKGHAVAFDFTGKDD
jgi:hypothetical protein